MSQARAVIPLALYLALFQILILQQLIADSWLITGGLFAVMVGLMFFMEGLQVGLMPLGRIIGSGLPRPGTRPLQASRSCSVSVPSCRWSFSCCWCRS